MLKNKVRKTLAATIMGSAFLTLTACSSVSATEGQYKFKQPELKVLKQDINQKILESSQRIEKKLELLNDTQKQKRATGQAITADYGVPMNMNIREITPEDVDLMIKEGRSNNNPAPDFNKLQEHEVTPVKLNIPQTVAPSSSTEPVNKFYKEPVQNPHQEIDFIGKSKPTAIKKEVEVKKEKQKKEKVKKDSKKSLDRSVTLKGMYQTTYLVKTLSAGAGYQFSLIGKDMLANKMNIGNKKEAFKGSIKDALINIGTSLGDKALISVDTDKKTITLEYK